MKKGLFLLISICLFATSCNNEASTPLINLSKSSLEVWFDEAEYSITVKSNSRWEALSSCDWLSIKTRNGDAGVSEFRFSVNQNDTGVSRYGEITIQGHNGSPSATISVKQHELQAELMSLYYTTTDNKAIAISNPSAFDGNIVENIYTNGVGTLTFDRTITSIGAEAFYGNETLATITLPTSVEEIKEYSFGSCTYLTSINLPDHLVSIGESAFAYCSRLKEIRIPYSVEYIGASAFSGCSGLTSICGKFASEDNRCLVINNVLVKYAPKGIDSYTIPEYITAIEADAFYESLALHEITIPASVESIGDYAFYYCENLEKVYCKATTPPTLGEATFDNSDNGTDKPIGCYFYVPNTSVERYKATGSWNKYVKYIKGYDF